MKLVTYDLRVIWACMKKDIKSALTDRVFTIVSVFLPVNFLILLSLFVISGGQAPTAVVMQDTGLYAQQFYTAMSHAHSFILQKMSLNDATQSIHQGYIVAVVVIPADFDMRIKQKQPVQVDVTINNLNTDFTNDIRRAVPLSITAFYAQAFPHMVTITPQESDAYPHDTDYIPYLTVSILVIALIIGSLLQSGTAAAREWHRVLRAGGRFIATREHVISRREDLPAFLKSHPLHHLYGGENAYLLDEYRSAIVAGGIRLERVLNPLQSEINLYPETLIGVKQRIARRVLFPLPAAIPDFALGWLGGLLNHPGRLYSFVGTRSAHE